MNKAPRLLGVAGMLSAAAKGNHRKRSVCNLGLAAAALLLATQGACVGSLENGTGADGGGESPEEVAAREAFEKDVMPILSTNCAACHASMANIDFLNPETDIRQTILTWPSGLLDLNAPTQSRLLTKGVHDGPAFTPEQAGVMLDWVNLEVLAAGVEGNPTVELDPFQPVVGINTVSLEPIGLSGSNITFRMEPLSTGMYLSELQVTAGPGGTRLVHPLFVTWTDSEPTPDPIDRFADIDLALAEGETGMIGGGTAVFVDVSPTAMLSIHFEVAETSDGSGGGGGDGSDPGGCQDVASFTANAQGPLSADCASCHAGNNASATNATNMTGINDLDPAVQAMVCGQILSRVNLADPPNSGIFIAPEPNNGAAHPFKFGGDVNAFNAFRDSLTIWINQENAQ